MKPTDLKFPYRWEERRPQIERGVFFLPDYYAHHDGFTFPKWRDLFSVERPVAIEFCSGNGSWVISKGLEQHYNWVSVEWRFERARKIWAKRENRQLDNLFIVCGEAQTFAREYVPTHSVDAVFINFPDPWPKEKHAKNRLFQRPFIEDLARIVKPGGVVTIVTDDPPFAEQIAHEMGEVKAWVPHFPKPYFATSLEGYGTSYFETLWREKGKTIHYFKYETCR